MIACALTCYMGRGNKPALCVWPRFLRVQKGETPLYAACGEDNLDSVGVLLAHGASLTKPDKVSITQHALQAPKT